MDVVFVVPEVALRPVASRYVTSLLISQTQALRFPCQLGSKDDAGVFSSVAATFKVSRHETVRLMLMLIKLKKKKSWPAASVLWKILDSI